MRNARLPQLDRTLFLTDGGIETTLIFLDGHDLPCFAAFHLLATPEGTAALRNYFLRYVAIARDAGAGFVLESPTWRASRDWGTRLGYSPERLAGANARAIDLLHGIRTASATPAMPMVVSGCIGPRGDGYAAGAAMSPEQAAEYHMFQARTFAAAGADCVSAMTMTTSLEAVGVVWAAQAEGVPAVISFTVETDGRLPSGESLREAIEHVDAATAAGAAYFMINCAHPTHFAAVLDEGPWIRRLRGLRANASPRSHAELDEATELDAGDPVALASAYDALCRRFDHLTVLGGCCGTDHRHVEQMALARRGAANGTHGAPGRIPRR